VLRTEFFRRQHQAANVLMLRLCNLVEFYRGPHDALRVAMQLARLLGQLRIHFANEDRGLLSVLIASGDCRSAALALRFRGELVTLSLELEAFIRRWSSSALIASDFATFRAELIRLLGRLDDQAERAVTTLYPVADRLDAIRFSDAA
jgi:hypothetical protein